MSQGAEDYMRAYREHQKMNSVYRMLPSMKAGNFWPRTFSQGWYIWAGMAVTGYLVFSIGYSEKDKQESAYLQKLEAWGKNTPIKAMRPAVEAPKKDSHH